VTYVQVVHRLAQVGQHGGEAERAVVVPLQLDRLLVALEVLPLVAGPQDVQVPAAAEAAVLLGVPARLPATAVQPVRPPVLLGLFLSAPLRQSINVAVASPDDVREERAGVLRVSTAGTLGIPSPCTRGDGSGPQCQRSATTPLVKKAGHSAAAGERRERLRLPVVRILR
jgi:hypothetical protein